MAAVVDPIEQAKDRLASYLDPHQYHIVDGSIRARELELSLRVDDEGLFALQDADKVQQCYGSMEIAVRRFVRMLEVGFERFSATAEPRVVEYPPTDPAESMVSHASGSHACVALEMSDDMLLTDLLEGEKRMSERGCLRISLVDPARIGQTRISFYEGGGPQVMANALRAFSSGDYPTLDGVSVRDFRVCAHRQGWPVKAHYSYSPKSDEYTILDEDVANPPKSEIIWSIVGSLGTYVSIAPGTPFDGNTFSACNGFIVESALRVKPGVADVGLDQKFSAAQAAICEGVRFGGHIVVESSDAPAPASDDDSRYIPIGIRDFFADLCTVFRKVPTNSDALVSNILMLCQAGRPDRGIQSLMCWSSLPGHERPRLRPLIEQHLGSDSVDEDLRLDMLETLDIIDEDMTRTGDRWKLSV